MNLYNVLCSLAASFGFVLLHGRAEAAVDHYKTLGLEKTASQRDIKTAFRNLALKYHPDKNKEENATDKFQEVTKAYGILSDPEKKKMYDKYGMDDDSKSNLFGNFDINGFFKQFDEALKRALQQGQEGKSASGSQGGSFGSFFDFDNLFSDMDDKDMDNFEALKGKPGSTKEGFASFSSKIADAMGDIVNKLQKIKGANKKPRGSSASQDDDADQDRLKNTKTDKRTEL